MFKIVVNGVVRVWQKHTISYEEILSLLHWPPESNPSVTYYRSFDNHAGSLRRGQAVPLGKYTTFDAAYTNNA